MKSTITFLVYKNRGGAKYVLNPAADGGGGKDKSHLQSTIEFRLYKNRGGDKFVLNPAADGGGGRAEKHLHAIVINSLDYE